MMLNCQVRGWSLGMAGGGGACRCLRMRLGAEEGPGVALFTPSRDRKRFRKGLIACPSGYVGAPGPDLCS